MAISLYRKYRPQNFEEVVGQNAIEKTLRNAVAEGNTSHAYLFCGPRGTGKTTTARLLAKAMLCKEGPTANPCCVCDQCEDVASGTHPDVYELDAASRTGVDNVREEIIGRVAFAPTRGRCKIYIIDEVHMLSTAAFNALLKTLEEPPDHVVFILCTTDPQKIPDTIISRCQRFDFHRISVADIVTNLRKICDGEGFTASDAALEMIARQSSGGMRDAITTLEQLSVLGAKTITESDVETLVGSVSDDEVDRFLELIARRDVAGSFSWLADFTESGTDLTRLVHDLTALVRNLYVSALTHSASGLEAYDDQRRSRLLGIAETFGGPERLARVLMLFGDLSQQLRQATDPRLCMEVALTRIAHPEHELTLEALAERIERLERAGVRAAATAAAAPAAAVAVASTPAPAPETRKAEQVVTTQATSKTANDGTRPVEPTQESRPATQTTAPEAGAASEAASLQTAQQQSDQLDERTLYRCWRAAMRDIGQRSKSLGGALMNAQSQVGPHGDDIVITLPMGADFIKQMIERGDQKATLSECLDVAFGRHVAFTVEVAQTPPPPPEAMPIEEVPSHNLFEDNPSAAPEPAVSAPAEDGLPPVDDDDEEYVFEDVPEEYEDLPPVDLPPRYESAPASDEPASEPAPEPAPAAGEGEQLAEGEMPAAMRDLILGSFSKHSAE